MLQPASHRFHYVLCLTQKGMVINMKIFRTREEIREYSKNTFYDRFRWRLLTGLIIIFFPLFLQIKSIFVERDFQYQKKLAEQLLAYERIDPIPIVIGKINNVEKSKYAFSREEVSETREYSYQFEQGGKIYNLKPR